MKCAEDGPRDWTIVELQGVLEARDPSQCIDSMVLGNVQRKGQKGVILTVGNQRMDGKVVELKQPLAIMERKGKDGEALGGEQDFEVVGFVRRKIVFLHRLCPRTTVLFLYLLALWQ